MECRLQPRGQPRRNISVPTTQQSMFNVGWFYFSHKRRCRYYLSRMSSVRTLTWLALPGLRFMCIEPVCLGASVLHLMSSSLSQYQYCHTLASIFSCLKGFRRNHVIYWESTKTYIQGETLHPAMALQRLRSYISISHNPPSGYGLICVSLVVYYIQYNLMNKRFIWHVLRLV